MPRVLGLAEQGLSDRRKVEELFDNGVLARLHTPRLNRFLAAVAETARAVGASWEFEPNSEELTAVYQRYCYVCGIELTRAVD
jgi:hypothetical protein